MIMALKAIQHEIEVRTELGTFRMKRLRIQKVEA